MKHHPKKIGMYQAIGLVAYIFVVAAFIQSIPQIMPDKSVNPIFGASLFLLLFVSSALICAAIAFGYPFALFFDHGKRHEAIEAVGWTIAWLVGIAFVLFALFIFFGLITE